MRGEFKLVVVGASAGGVSALQALLSGLPRGFSLPIVVTQHLPRESHFDFNLIFGETPAGRVCEAEDKMPLERGHVYMAPPDYHLLFEREGTMSLTQDDLVHFSRPSIDVMFESAARAFGANVIGVLLTGANEDGARGLCEIHQHGGRTVVQNPETAEVPTMPHSALQLFTPDRVANLEDIAQWIALQVGG